MGSYGKPNGLENFRGDNGDRIKKFHGWPCQFRHQTTCAGISARNQFTSRFQSETPPPVRFSTVQSATEASTKRSQALKNLILPWPGVSFRRSGRFFFPAWKVPSGPNGLGRFLRPTQFLPALEHDGCAVWKCLGRWGGDTNTLARFESLSESKLL